MNRKVMKVSAVCAAVVLLAALLVGCVSATAGTVKVGNDVVPTLYSVVGKREISGTQSGVSEEGKYRILTYGTGDVTEEDVWAYIEALQAQGYLATIDTQRSGGTLYQQMGAESEDEGQIVLVEITYDPLTETVIRYLAAPGTLTRYSELETETEE